MRPCRAGRFAALRASLLVACVAAAGTAVAQAPPGPAAAWPLPTLDARLQERLLALDAQSVSARDVREVLAFVPAPRIVLLHGSVPVVTMAPFAQFLINMGYPAERLRHPRDGSLSQASGGDSRELAGSIAWFYEREGVLPLLIGHSQGGMLALKALQDLAGASGESLAVWDPVRAVAEPRSSIVDPLSGAERPVVGLQLPYAAALATGRAMRVLLGQWELLPRLRSVPDSVAEFSGYFVAWDPIAFTGPDAARDDPYRASGSARVRTLMLPADYGHLRLPLAAHLTEDPATRAWIEAFDPREQAVLPPQLPGADLRNIVHAADIWYSVKKSWCLQAQQWVRAARGSSLVGG